MRFDLELIPEGTRPYFRDVYDHAVRINEMVDILRELLTTALEANFSLISIVAERGDEEVRRLGRDHRGADHDRRHLRDELPARCPS